MDVFALEPAGEHGAAADHQGRDVDPEHGHQHAGGHLVAVGDHDHGIKGMGLGHYLN